VRINTKILGGFLVLIVPGLFAQSVQGPQGGSYTFASSGEQVTSVTNDDGSVVHYFYDSAGNSSGLTVNVHNVALTMHYAVNADGSGWVQAGALPPLICTNDSDGRTVAAVLYPGMQYENGVWNIDWSAPDPIYAASFSYAATGHLSSVALDSGLTLNLGAPDVQGNVPQSLIKPDGTIAATAIPKGDTNGVRVIPSQLDAIATRFGLGGDWAQTLTFPLSASGNVTIARNGTTILMYLVDAGPYRVGFAPNGTALFYDFMPTYATQEIVETDTASPMAGAAPSHIVVTADGAAGMYMDSPAYGAIYSAWTETNISGAIDTRYATLSPPSEQIHGGPGLRVRSEMFRGYQIIMCVLGTCFVYQYFEWVDDPIESGGSNPPSSTGSTPPAGGGRPPVRTGNQVNGDPKLHIKVDRGLNEAKQQLQSESCKSLLNRIGVDGKKLSQVLSLRGYNDPITYMRTHLTYVAGTDKDCTGNPMASTNVYSRTVAICRPFGNANDTMAAVYLIHEMLHTLGYGEGPKYQGFPTSSTINQQVQAACAN